MKRLSGTLIATLFMACGGDHVPTRSTDLGELWISTAAQVDGASDLGIDFGVVPVGGRRTIEIEGFNAGADPISVTGIQFDESTDGFYYLNAPSLPLVLATDERFKLSVTFAPGASGESTSRLVLKATGRTSGARGMLKGVGE